MKRKLKLQEIVYSTTKYNLSCFLCSVYSLYKNLADSYHSANRCDFEYEKVLKKKLNMSSMFMVT